MDAKGNLLVAATAERHVHILNLRNPTSFHKTLQSPLKQQTRVVSCLADASGFAIASTEGRCAFQYLDDKDARYKPSSFELGPVMLILENKP